jgi:flagellar biosynthesis anti-sigma factor FlgM
MKVDRSMEKIVSAIQIDGVEKNQVNGQKKEKSNVTQTDEVSISGLICYLNHSLSVDEISTVRSERISMLKEKIEAGSYHVSGQAVAQKMLGMCAMTR